MLVMELTYITNGHEYNHCNDIMGMIKVIKVIKIIKIESGN